MNLSLEKQFDELIEQLELPILSSSQIFPLIDLTRLDEGAQLPEIHDLVVRAQQDNVAAICVFPQHLAWIPILDSIQRATVVNFPTGNFEQDQVLQNIEQAIQTHQADEIDYVFPYSYYLAGKKSHALAWAQEAYQLCRRYNCMFKVILETGALPSLELIYQLSSELIAQGCDMLKTSTGKTHLGATLPAAFSILNAIKDSQTRTGLKISGGIKTCTQASTYIHLAEHVLEQEVNNKWFRIGASSLQKD